MRTRRIAAAAAWVLALAATPAAAQSLPAIHISPPDGTEAGPSVPVEVSWSHETMLNASSRSITLTNGAGTSNVTSGFTYEPRPQVPDGPAAAISRNTLVLAAGVNTITAYICGGSGGDCASETSRVTYTPPPPPVNHAAPEISLSPHSDFYRDYTAEAATASYSAPGYVSMGQPRALTLGYSSALADPQVFLQVDVRDPSLTPATRLSIKVRPQGGSTWLTLTNGLTEAFYAGATTAGSVSRLAAQVPLSAFGPGAESGLYKLEAEVTSHWTNVSPAVTRTAIQVVKVPVLSRRRSPYGPGWGVQGVQQAFPSADGVLIDEGNGTVRYFYVQNGSYVSPPGDESTLAWVPGDSLVRRYPDGTRAVFGPVLAGSSPQVRQHLYTASLLGQRVSYAYNGALLQTMTDPAGLQTVLAYAANAAGTVLLSAVTSPGGRQITLTHDSINTWVYARTAR
jgi:hypothetical protein